MLSTIRDGDERNPNAALNIFRSFDNASVVKCLIGSRPKTGWVMDYPLFERIYYLLVTGCDVYGNSGHQLNSHLYMDHAHARRIQFPAVPARRRAQAGR